MKVGLPSPFQEFDSSPQWRYACLFALGVALGSSQFVQVYQTKTQKIYTQSITYKVILPSWLLSSCKTSGQTDTDTILYIYKQIYNDILIHIVITITQLLKNTVELVDVSTKDVGSFHSYTGASGFAHLTPTAAGASASWRQWYPNRLVAEGAGDQSFLGCI